MHSLGKLVFLARSPNIIISSSHDVHKPSCPKTAQSALAPGRRALRPAPLGSSASPGLKSELTGLLWADGLLPEVCRAPPAPNSLGTELWLWWNCSADSGSGSEPSPQPLFQRLGAGAEPFGVLWPLQPLSHSSCGWLGPRTGDPSHRPPSCGSGPQFLSTQTSVSAVPQSPAVPRSLGSWLLTFWQLGGSAPSGKHLTWYPAWFGGWVGCCTWRPVSVARPCS